MIVLSDDKDGRYCSICGGIPAEGITVKKILVEGIESGIDHFDAILDEVRKLRLLGDHAVSDAILRRAGAYSDKKDRLLPCCIPACVSPEGVTIVPGLRPDARGMWTPTLAVRSFPDWCQRSGFSE